MIYVFNTRITKLRVREKEVSQLGRGLKKIIEVK
jgi:hypothetical protein